MNKLKKVLVILTVVAIILPTIYSSVFAATKDDIILSILEEVQEMADRLSENGDGTQITDSTKLKQIALYWKQQAEANGLKMQEFLDFDKKYLGGRILGDTTTSLYACYKEIIENPNLEEQVNNPDKTKEEKEELERKAKNLYDKGLTKLTNEELTQLDNLLKEYKNKYPSEWTMTNMMRIYSRDVKEEIDKRKREDKIDKGYDSAEDETNKDRDKEQDQLKDNTPPTGLLGNADASAKHTPDEIIGEAQNFRDKANAITTINGANLEAGSSTVYNILLSIGIFLAVAIGMYLGVKFMLSNAEDKAKVKEALIPYIAGCVVIFSAFIIWKLAILLLSGIK